MFSLQSQTGNVLMFGCSVRLRGRHKVTSLCLSGFRRHPGDSTPAPGWSLVCQRRASGDLGVGGYSAAAGCRKGVRGVA